MTLRADEESLGGLGELPDRPPYVPGKPLFHVSGTGITESEDSSDPRHPPNGEGGIRVCPCTSGISSDLVDEAPAPLLSGLDRSYERMLAGPGVRARVAVGRAVTTADLAALQADAQMQPPISRGQAILTSGDGLGELSDASVAEMAAGRH
jgi:hypothetical protein